MKLIRQSARPQRRAHLNRTELFKGRVPVSKLIVGDDTVSVPIRWEPSKGYGSQYFVELTRDDLVALAQAMNRERP